MVEAKGKGNLLTYQVELKTTRNEISFNKRISQSSPKHSFFNSPKNAKASKFNQITKFSDMFKDTSQISMNFNSINNANNDLVIEKLQNFDELDVTKKQIIEKNNESSEKIESSDIIFKSNEIFNKLNKNFKQDMCDSNNLFPKIGSNFTIKKSKSLENWDMIDIPLEITLRSMQDIEKKHTNIKITKPTTDSNIIQKFFNFKSNDDIHHKKNIIDFQTILNKIDEKDVHQLQTVENEKKMEEIGNEKTLIEANPNNNIIIPNFAIIEEENLLNPPENNHKSCIDLQKISIDLQDDKPVIENFHKKLGILKSLADLGEIPENEKIEEFYEYAPKKPGSFEENNNQIENNKSELPQMDFETVKNELGENLFLHPNKFWLNFKDKQLSLKFWSILDIKTNKNDRCILIITIIYCFAMTFLQIILNSVFLYNAYFLTFKILVLIGISIIIFFESKIKFSYFKVVIASLFTLFIMLILISQNYNIGHIYLSKIDLIFIYCCLSQLNRITFIEQIFTSLIFLLLDTIYVFSLLPPDYYIIYINSIFSCLDARIETYEIKNAN